jgi:hypothetical protein
MLLDFLLQTLKRRPAREGRAWIETECLRVGPTTFDRRPAREGRAWIETLMVLDLQIADGLSPGPRGPGVD